MATKAVVIGGSSGIGLSVSRELRRRGYVVKVLGIHEPEDLSGIEYSYCDLRCPDISQLEALAEDQDINLLFIASGVGRFADFQYFTIPEIEKILTVDTLSVIKILRVFYDKIRTWGGAVFSLRRNVINFGACLYAFRSSLRGGKGRALQIHREREHRA